MESSRRLVVSFVLSWRFPRNDYACNTIRLRYGPDMVKKFRWLEDKEMKLEKNSLDLNFLTSCKAYHIIPHFLQFKLYKNSLQSSFMYRNFQQQLLDDEIEDKKVNIKKLSDFVNNIKNELAALV